jgi:hypothetical protein
MFNLQEKIRPYRKTLTTDGIHKRLDFVLSVIHRDTQLVYRSLKKSMADIYNLHLLE